MNEAIKNLCIALKEEAEAVISYTDKINAVANAEGMETVTQKLEMIRLDEVEHIQTLTLELTKLMADSTEPVAEENEQ